MHAAGMRQAAPGKGAVLEVTQWGSLLLYATQRGGIHAWDLRTDINAWTIPCSPNQASCIFPFPVGTLLKFNRSCMHAH